MTTPRLGSGLEQAVGFGLGRYGRGRGRGITVRGVEESSCSTLSSRRTLNCRPELALDRSAEEILAADMATARPAFWFEGRELKAGARDRRRVSCLGTRAGADAQHDTDVRAVPPRVA